MNDERFEILFRPKFNPNRNREAASAGRAPILPALVLKPKDQDAHDMEYIAKLNESVEQDIEVAVASDSSPVTSAMSPRSFGVIKSDDGSNHDDKSADEGVNNHIEGLNHRVAEELSKDAQSDDTKEKPSSKSNSSVSESSGSEHFDPTPAVKSPQVGFGDDHVAVEIEKYDHSDSDSQTNSNTNSSSASSHNVDRKSEEAATPPVEEESNEKQDILRRASKIINIVQKRYSQDLNDADGGGRRKSLSSGVGKFLAVSHWG